MRQLHQYKMSYFYGQTCITIFISLASESKSYQTSSLLNHGHIDKSELNKTFLLTRMP